MKAIIGISGRQFHVQDGDIIEIFRVNHKKGEQFSIQDIYAIEKDGVLIVDKASLKNYSVLVEVVDEKKGEKIHVFKKKKKTGYHRKIGHRDYISVIKIIGIQTTDATS